MNLGVLYNTMGLESEESPAEGLTTFRWEAIEGIATFGVSDMKDVMRLPTMRDCGLASIATTVANCL